MNKFLSVTLLLMLVITGISLLATRESTPSLPADSASGKASIGGAFTLIDRNGNSISDSEFRGKIMMVFFGFTHCPDVCPLTLATYTSTLELLGDKASLVAPVFITIDPARDTPERLKEFLANFDPRIIGLTGTEAQIKDVAALYKTYYSEEQGGMMNHSALIYIMGKDGAYIEHFPHTIAPEKLTKALLEVVP